MDSHQGEQLAIGQPSHGGKPEEVVAAGHNTGFDSDTSIR